MAGNNLNIANKHPGGKILVKCEIPQLSQYWEFRYDQGKIGNFVIWNFSLCIYLKTRFSIILVILALFCKTRLIYYVRIDIFLIPLSSSKFCHRITVTSATTSVTYFFKWVRAVLNNHETTIIVYCVGTFLEWVFTAPYTKLPYNTPLTTPRTV